MKVKIGPYKRWIGPYQIARKIPFLNEETADVIGEKLTQTYLDDICRWIDKKKSDRVVKVHIDDYDLWNMDHTLSLIIVPMLEHMKDAKPGVPYVDLEDVPENLRYVTGTDSSEDHPESFFWMQRRWEWVLEEMIFAHKHIIDDDWVYATLGNPDEYERINNRVTNGLNLFGKYYRALWT